ncbi:MAG: MmgE/PrpD family protein [Acetomicrobium sp.]
MSKTIAETLADFIHDATYENLPKEVIHQAKRCLMDTCGAIIAGSFHSKSGKVAQSYAKTLEEPQTATIIGTTLMRSPQTAAFANGIAAHALELDDGSRHATYHPGSSIVPASLAICEAEGKTAQDLITAIAVGYEVSIRIGKSMNPHHYLRGFHPTGTIAHFGTAAACSKVLGLNIEEITNALGLAGSLASGINQYEIDGSLVKHLHPGNAARNGILTALLAKEGLTGPKGVIEGRLGFCHCFSDEYDISSITEGLGAQYDILSIYFKPYPSCRYVHYANEATLNILKEHPLTPDDIDQIHILTHKNAKQGSDIPDYQTVLHARLSIQYGIASIIVRGKAGLQEYTEEAIQDPRVREIAKKITIEIDPEIQKLYPNPRSMIVEIKDKKGNVYSSRVDYPKGDPENPMTDDELIEKFIDVTGQVISKESQAKVIENTLRIAPDAQVKEMMELFRFEA